MFVLKVADFIVCVLSFILTRPRLTWPWRPTPCALSLRSVAVQVFTSLPPELFGSHDLTVDVIVTPTQVIRVTQRHAKPTGIIWKLVTPRKLKAIPVLKALREVEAT